MNEFSFTTSDLIVWVGAFGPALTALFAFYSRLNKFILQTKTVNDEQTKYIKDLTDRMESLDQKLSDESRDIRDRVKDAHDRINPLEAKISAIEGWKEGIKAAR